MNEDKPNVQKWQDTISKLLAKAESSAVTPEERDALLEKVSFLMTKYGIEEAILNPKSTEAVINVFITASNPYANWKSILLNVISNIFGCKAIVIDKMNTSVRHHVFGYQSDIERVFMLYNSLLIQMVTAMASSQSLKPTHVHGKAFNNSFVIGFVNEAAKRLQDSYMRAKSEANESNPGTDIVLADRAAIVLAEVHRNYPVLKTSNVTSRNTSDAGYNAGRSAGRNTDIGHTRVGPRRKAIGN